MLSPGTVVGGRYRLLRRVGEGGMATVWHAEHQTLGSPVAVKFLHSARNTEESTERFLREARVAAAVRHRNVVEIIDFGLTDDQVPYMVMELLVGQSLASAYTGKSPPDVVSVLRVMSLCLRGLAAVHDAGIVHRDIKPENIFLVEDADGTFPKLLDFGVSRAARDTGDTSRTREGALVGTPDYMSPEQARGLRDVDRRTDIYSMGAILYEGVTGRLPFESENLGDLIVMITTQPPRPVTEFRNDLGEKLPALIHKAIAKNREERFQDAREMRQSVLECLRELDPEVDKPTVSSEWPERGTGNVSVRRLVPTPEESGATAAVRPSRDAMADITPAGGIPPYLAGRARVQPHEEPKSPARLRVAVIAGAGLLLGASLILVATILGALSREGTEAETQYADDMADATPLELLRYPTAGPYTEVLAADLARPGLREPARVRIVLHRVPEGAVVLADGVPVSPPVLEVPREAWTYRLAVVDARGSGWEIEHPGLVDGEYEVWVDGGTQPTLDVATESPPTKRGRKRRVRRRPRRAPEPSVRTAR